MSQPPERVSKWDREGEKFLPTHSRMAVGIVHQRSCPAVVVSVQVWAKHCSTVCPACPAKLKQPGTQRERKLGYYPKC